MAARWEESRRAVIPLTAPRTAEQIQRTARALQWQAVRNAFDPSTWDWPALPNVRAHAAELSASLRAQYVEARSWWRHLMWRLPIPDAWLPERELLPDERSTPLSKRQKRRRLYRLRECAFRLEKVLQFHDWRAAKVDHFGYKVDMDAFIERWQTMGRHNPRWFKAWVSEQLDGLMLDMWEVRYDKDDFTAHFWRADHFPGLRRAIAEVLEPQDDGLGDVKLLVPDGLDELTDDEAEGAPDELMREEFDAEEEAEIEAPLPKWPAPPPVALFDGYKVVDVFWAIGIWDPYQMVLLFCWITWFTAEFGSSLYMIWYNKRHWTPPPDRLMW